MARNIVYIIIHEADTPTGKHFTANDIDQWHKERGFERSPEWRAKFNPQLEAIGYHYVIGVHGELWTGRHLQEIPAAVGGYNSVSINICLIGKGRYTPSQWNALKSLVEELHQKYPKAEVKGHCQFSTAIIQKKTCPDFNVPQWYAAGMTPAPEHIA